MVAEADGGCHTAGCYIVDIAKHGAVVFGGSLMTSDNVCDGQGTSTLPNHWNFLRVGFGNGCRNILGSFTLSFDGEILHPMILKR